MQPLAAACPGDSGFARFDSPLFHLLPTFLASSEHHAFSILPQSWNIGPINILTTRVEKKRSKRLVSTPETPTPPRVPRLILDVGEYRFPHSCAQAGRKRLINDDQGSAEDGTNAWVCPIPWNCMNRKAFTNQFDESPLPKRFRLHPCPFMS